LLGKLCFVLRGIHCSLFAAGQLSIAVHVNDPEYDSYQEARELPPHRLAVLKRFFNDDKTLEHKEVIVGEILRAKKTMLCH
jgi:inorganic pyrophosphatase